MLTMPIIPLRQTAKPRLTLLGAKMGRGISCGEASGLSGHVKSGGLLRGLLRCFRGGLVILGPLLGGACLQLEGEGVVEAVLCGLLLG